ncbi:MAG: RNA polymerase sigma-70 factor [Opitutae bacterium]|nr:RNA polymerase sigma-70 factor [Opitutae bacterium]
MTGVLTEHRPLLFGIAYRMLGRVAEAEDVVQETFLRWQRQDPAEIRTPKAWLVATATRLCIDQLRSARHQREEYYGVWLPEPLVEATAAAPDAAAELADSLTLAFLRMLETFTPVERAVFLLHEAFGYDYAEISRIVGKTEANCRQLATRARKRLAEARPATEPVSRAQAEKVAQKFFAASTTGDLQGLLATLTDNVVLYSDGGGKVLAAGQPIVSADHVSRFFIGIGAKMPADGSVELTRVNGRVGALVRIAGKLESVFAFELAGGRISAIYVVRNPDKLQHLGLPLRANLLRTTLHRRTGNY